MKNSSLSSCVLRLASYVGVAFCRNGEARCLPYVGAASCRAILPLALALVALPAQAEMVKAIDMEHHFFLPEFVEFMKTRQDYPNWKDGLGVFYRPGALFMIDHPPGSETGKGCAPCSFSQAVSNAHAVGNSGSGLCG